MTDVPSGGKIRSCKDCRTHWEETGDYPPRERPAPYPGPRCATHHRETKKRRKEQAHALKIEAEYGLSIAQYWRLYELQKGKCAICRRATGKTRRLSVDHDHATGKVRGLLCRPCNNLLGHARDDPAFFDRATYYLNHPPAELL